ncbi:hypothetical protein ACK3YT_17760 [Aeromonas caviae]|uniref:hypothetical protein n=1 Tax=Aeromonas caviae TaxID=648 RepID=UPI00191E789E|nr:hypothetical protein [Aeromonas caviae]MBL0558897.1 hypothetical protein [Aeromonas caviae]MBL0584189.1 hypothetical protein [Aeromonas caviae]MDX7611435.1 hypothetical protein [Aeromonas caviae]USP60740.1 hypothetical protein J6625_12070 [Aeromonas caviae]
MLQSLLVYGEGPTDMGGSRNAQAYAHGADLQVGSMLRLAHRLLGRHLPDWNADQFDWQQEHAIPTVLVAPAEMTSLVGQAKKNKTFKLTSKKTKSGYLIHSRRAEILGILAQRAGSLTQAQLAIYFHDTDGANRDPHDPHDLVQAVNEGFRAAGFAGQGIAMVPQPTSEAWLICSCKPDAYQHCAQLETQLSGNDRSPARAPKLVLGHHLRNTDYHRGDLLPVVNAIALDRLDMPTFNQCRNDVKQGIHKLCGAIAE